VRTADCRLNQKTCRFRRRPINRFFVSHSTRSNSKKNFGTPSTLQNCRGLTPSNRNIPFTPLKSSAFQAHYTGVVFRLNGSALVL
jgi:hypothetical protein